MKNSRNNVTLTRKEAEKEALAQKMHDLLDPEPQQVGKPYYDNFVSYVADYPEAERYRAYLTRGNREALAFVLLRREKRAFFNTFPGHYMALTISKNAFGKLPDGSPKTWVQLTFMDNDDGLYIRTWDGQDDAEARAVLAEMKQMAPFSIKDAMEYFGLQPQ